ncbi:LOW QUALITY PROTEIN: endoplasmic reticulum metallopeptidase 1-like, partial [Rhagoletis pomonella]|uniref:LOW QUALITY PROTEIN: endoplasmic reticulum metallopeptidase 1-like n=1 Tax=Rhagoletis pomonella TaxID=28610 RepID=UPI001786BC84
MEENVSDQSTKMGPKNKQHKKLPWYYAPIYTAFWVVLYLAVVLTQVNYLPTTRTRADELAHPDSFIGERAEDILLNLTKLGPRVFGSEANEIKAIELILNEIKNIQKIASDYFVIEVDTQVASGEYLGTRLYQGVQNVVAKLSAKNNTSSNYLLINAHFDSAVSSPGASDDGSMVSTVLEVFRVIAKSDGPLEHPIVFLFNGAEEEWLYGSHGFVTQHKWAKNCKVVINLDACGSRGRELLFQYAADSSWLINYYKRVPHLFATAMAEEFFSNGFIPSSTDFVIFRDYGGMQGVDLAYIFNGYVYHTEFDRMDALSKGSLQSTGDNILSLAKAIGNAPEMRNITADYNNKPIIYYDFLGWFMLSYTLNTGIIINFVVCLVTLIAIGISMFFMSKHDSLGWRVIIAHCALAFLIQILSVALGAGSSILIAYLMDSMGYSMSWFSSNWLIFGLYFCPMFFCLGIFPAIFLKRTKQHPLCLSFRIQLFMHSQCLILIALTIALTLLSIRSAFMPMLAIFFYAVPLIINLITKLHGKGQWFAIAVIASQIISFLYFSYVAQFLYNLLIPIMGRIGTTLNPDIVISIVAIIFSLLIAGFLMPIYFLYRKSRTIIFCFLGSTLLFIILAITPIGSPYTPRLAPQRYSVQHANQIYYNADGSTFFNDSAFYVYAIDRHINTAEEVINHFKAAHDIDDACSDGAACELSKPSFWLPVDESPILPGEKPLLALTAKTMLNATNIHRYNFTLTGPDHLSILIKPKASTKIINWSFDQAVLKRKEYYFVFSYGKYIKPLEFFMDLESPANGSALANLEIAVSGNWIHQSVQRTEIYEEFLKSFPAYTTLKSWVAIYE